MVFIISMYFMISIPFVCASTSTLQLSPAEAAHSRTEVRWLEDWCDGARSVFNYGGQRFRSQHLRWRTAHDRPHLDGHVQWSSAWSRCRRGLGRDGVGALGRVDVDDPVAGKKLLRLGKYSVRDRLTILPGPHQLRLIGKCQALGRNQLARFLQLLVQLHHEGDVR